MQKGSSRELLAPGEGSRAMDETGLFVEAGNPEELSVIRECLDTGAAFDGVPVLRKKRRVEENPSWTPQE